MSNPLDDVTKALQDAAFVSIGLGVMAFQKAQVQRQELRKAMRGTVAEARTAVEDNLKLIEERLRSARP